MPVFLRQLPREVAIVQKALAGGALPGDNRYYQVAVRGRTFSTWPFGPARVAS
jgi:hypothetical protein